MKYRQLGNTDLKISSIGFGTWGFANDPDAWVGATRESSELALLTALNQGLNFIDTARTYGNGLAEEWLGQILRQNPDYQPIIASKMFPLNQEWSGMKGVPIKEAFPKTHIIQQVDDSLRALKRDQLDVMYFHVWEDEWANDLEWQETISAITQAGKVHYWGISTNDYEPTNCLKACKTGLISVVMTIFNLFYQLPAQVLFPKARELGIGIVARVPLDEGGLSGKLNANSSFADGDFRQTYFSPKRLRELEEHLSQFRPLMNSYGVGSLPDLALRYILSFDEVTSTIPGMRKVEHVFDNTRVSDLPPLDKQLLEELQNHAWNRNFYDEE